VEVGCRFVLLHICSIRPSDPPRRIHAPFVAKASNPMWNTAVPFFPFGALGFLILRSSDRPSASITPVAFCGTQLFSNMALNQVFYFGFLQESKL
jgi:hypothetical protein